MLTTIRSAIARANERAALGGTTAFCKGRAATCSNDIGLTHDNVYEAVFRGPDLR